MASRRSAARLGSQLLCFCNRHSTRCSGLPLSSCIVLLEPARRCIAHGSVLIIDQHRKVSWNEAQCWLCAGQSSHHEALCCLRPSAAGHVTASPGSHGEQGAPAARPSTAHSPARLCRSAGPHRDADAVPVSHHVSGDACVRQEVPAGPPVMLRPRWHCCFREVFSPAVQLIS